MVRVLTFKKIKLFNHFPAIERDVTTGSSNADKIMERYVATARVIARRSMKKAPKRPKSRFGNRQAYTKRSKKFGQTYWRKGQYSRPGEPPFWHPQKNASRTLRNIKYVRLGYARYAVGPVMFKGNPYDVPGLHERGGSVKVKTLSYYDRQNQGIRRPTAGLAVYPKRPFMRPALLKAKYYATGNAKTFVNKMNSIGRMIPTKRAV